MINYKNIAVGAGILAGSYAIGYAIGVGIELWMYNKARKLEG